VGLFFDKGQEALAQIADICRRAPGGSGAYTMCFHGLGHGVLAYTGYDLEKTVALCEKTGTPQYNNREPGECVGGAIMEMIGGGFHDKEAWKAERVKYLKKDNPLYPCSSDMIPQNAKYSCYSYLTPHLFESAGGDLSSLGSENYEKAFKFCNKIPLTDTMSRQACFAGFGKEFVVLAKARDTRKINELTEDEMKKVHDWCYLAKVEDGITHCLMGGMASVFWGGENDPKVSIKYCSLLGDSKYRDTCFNVFLGEAFRYMGDQARAICPSLPKNYQDKCLKG
jgi:hypothetical protein